MSTMCLIYTFLVVCVVLYDVIDVVDSVDTLTKGFSLSGSPDIGMLTLTCSATHLPRDVTYMYHVDMSRKSINRTGSKSRVIASLKPTGE